MTALAATASAALLLLFLLGTVVLLCFVMCTALAQEWKLWKALRGLAPRAAASNSLVNCNRPFVPLVISMPAAWTQYTNAWLRNTSDSVSNPEHDVSRTGLGTFAAPYTNALNSSSSRIRLWTRNGGEYRVNTRVGLGFALIVQFMHAFADARGESTEIQITSRTPQKLIDLRLQMKTNELAFVCTIKKPSEETLRLASSKSHGNTLMWKTIGEDGNTSHVKTKNRQNFTLKYPLPNSYGITVLPDSEKHCDILNPNQG